MTKTKRLNYPRQIIPRKDSDFLRGVCTSKSLKQLRRFSKDLEFAKNLLDFLDQQGTRRIRMRECFDENQPCTTKGIQSLAHHIVRRAPLEILAAQAISKEMGKVQKQLEQRSEELRRLIEINQNVQCPDDFFGLDEEETERLQQDPDSYNLYVSTHVKEQTPGWREDMAKVEEDFIKTASRKDIRQFFLERVRTDTVPM